MRNFILSRSYFKMIVRMPGLKGGESMTMAFVLFMVLSGFIELWGDPGDIIWEKNFGPVEAYSSDVSVDDENNYVVVYNYSHDFHILKLDDETGAPIWSRTYSDLEAAYPAQVKIDHQGYYVVALDASSLWKSEYSGRKRGRNLPVGVLKIDPETGDTLWMKTFLPDSSSAIRGLAVDKDGNYVLVGWTWSGSGPNNEDILVIKVNSTSGELIWARTYGFPNRRDRGYGIAVDDEGFYVVVGYGGEDEKNYTELRKGWVLKIDPSTGDTLWTVLFEDMEESQLGRIIEDGDGNYVIVGTYSFIGDYESWLFKMDSQTGDLLWSTFDMGGGILAGLAKDRNSGYILSSGTICDGYANLKLAAYSTVSGDRVWSKFVLEEVYCGRGYLDLEVDRNGDYLICGYDGGFVLLKVEPLFRDVVWFKLQWDSTSASGSHHFYGPQIAFENNGNCVLAYAPYFAAAVGESLFIKTMDAYDGDSLDAFAIGDTAWYASNFDLAVDSDGYYVVAVSIDVEHGISLLKIDPSSHSVVWRHDLRVVHINIYGDTTDTITLIRMKKLLVGPDGGYYVIGDGAWDVYANNYYRRYLIFLLLKINGATGDLEWFSYIGKDYLFVDPDTLDIVGTFYRAATLSGDGHAILALMRIFNHSGPSNWFGVVKFNTLTGGIIEFNVYSIEQLNFNIDYGRIAVDSARNYLVYVDDRPHGGWIYKIDSSSWNSIWQLEIANSLNFRYFSSIAVDENGDYLLFGVDSLISSALVKLDDVNGAILSITRYNSQVRGYGTAWADGEVAIDSAGFYYLTQPMSREITYGEPFYMTVGVIKLYGTAPPYYIINEDLGSPFSQSEVSCSPVFIGKGSLKIELNSQKEQSAKIAVYTVSGREFLKDEVFLRKGRNVIKFPCKAGVYFVKITMGDRIIMKKGIVIR